MRICVRPLLLNVFVDGLCIAIKFSNYLSLSLFLFPLMIYEFLWTIESPQDYSLLQMHTDSICKWCISHMKCNISVTRVI
jgi:hypothetical protein